MPYTAKKIFSPYPAKKKDKIYLINTKIYTLKCVFSYIIAGGFKSSRSWMLITTLILLLLSNAVLTIRDISILF